MVVWGRSRCELETWGRGWGEGWRVSGQNDQKCQQMGQERQNDFSSVASDSEIALQQLRTRDFPPEGLALLQYGG